MSGKIEYDFQLSKSVCDNLEEVIREIDSKALDPAEDNITLISASWRSAQSEVLSEKYRLLTADIQKLRDELEAEIEGVRALSRRMYLAEQEAKKKVLEKEN